MKKRLFFLALISLFALQLQAAGIQPGTGTYYKGTINGNLKIVMYLEVSVAGSETIYSGWYYYESQGESKKIALSGNWRGGTTMLTESVNGVRTGTFTLNGTGEGLRGTWNGNGKEFAVVLTEMK